MFHSTVLNFKLELSAILRTSSYFYPSAIRKLWNSLPAFIKSLTSPSLLKLRLKSIPPYHYLHTLLSISMYFAINIILLTKKLLWIVMIFITMHWNWFLFAVQCINDEKTDMIMCTWLSLMHTICIHTFLYALGLIWMLIHSDVIGLISHLFNSAFSTAPSCKITSVRASVGSVFQDADWRCLLCEPANGTVGQWGAMTSSFLPSLQ